MCYIDRQVINAGGFVRVLTIECSETLVSMVPGPVSGQALTLG